MWLLRSVTAVLCCGWVVLGVAAYASLTHLG
jgi:hypothetical protein